jgi:modulator of FtsH protease HflK
VSNENEPEFPFRIFDEIKRRSNGSSGANQPPPEMPDLSKFAFPALVILFVGFAVLGSYYQVDPEEEGVVLRFGEYHSTAQPGPHFKLPFGIDHVHKVPTKRQMKMEFGFRTAKAGQRTTYSRGTESLAESEMLTGDLNVADVEWVVQYHIHDPQAYLFRARNIDEIIRDVAESVMRQMVGDTSVNYLLTQGRETLANEAKDTMTIAVQRFDLGITIDQLITQDVNPPKAVRNSFNEVNQAQQEKERAINEALAEYNQAIPQARGKAEQNISQAEGFRAERVNRSKGDVASFLEVQAAYAKSKSVTRTRLHLEMLEEVLPKIKDKWILPAKGGNILQHLNLGKKQ